MKIAFQKLHCLLPNIQKQVYNCGLDVSGIRYIIVFFLLVFYCIFIVVQVQLSPYYCFLKQIILVM